MKDILTTIMEITGALLIIIGVCSISPAATAIVAGVLLIASGVIAA